MAYFIQSDMTGLVPEAWLSDGMDDAGTGEPDAFAAVQASAETAINGALAGRYNVPLVTEGNEGLAACVKEMAVCFAIEALFTRRQAPIDEKSPLAKRIARAWKTLDAMADGSHPLSVAINRANDSAIIISEDSRVASDSLAA